MFGLDKLALIAGTITGAVLAGMVVLPVGYFIGKYEGRSLERAAALQQSMDLIRKRSETNAKINSLDDSGLCAALGGKWVPDNGCE